MILFSHTMKKTFYSFFLAFILISCEGFVGENGVVVDVVTGERISNVIVELKSSNVSGIKDTTSLDGYFRTSTLVGCVFGGCDKYELHFSKSGYENIKIDEKYSRGSEAKYLNQSDTLIVEMKKR